MKIKQITACIDPGKEISTRTEILFALTEDNRVFQYVSNVYNKITGKYGVWVELPSLPESSEKEFKELV